MQTKRTELERGRDSTLDELRWRAEWIRLKTIELVEIAGIGHYSSISRAPSSFAPCTTGRSGSIPVTRRTQTVILLGKGHAAVGLYPCLANLGFPGGVA